MLIMDTPKGCDKCILGKSGRCCVKDFSVCMMTNYIPDWCPLKPVPDRINLRQYVDNTSCGLDSIVAYQYAQGRNDCIDEILEGEKE